MRWLLACLAIVAATAAQADYYTPAIGGGSPPPPGGDAVLMINGLDNVLNVGGLNICLAATLTC
jgi:hypothetical protein